MSLFSKQNDDNKKTYNILGLKFSKKKKLPSELSPKRKIKKLKAIFNKSKKANNALTEVSKQIEKVLNEITYLNTLLFQISISNNNDLEEIKNELMLNGYLKQSSKFKKKHCFRPIQLPFARFCRHAMHVFLRV